MACEFNRKNGIQKVFRVFDNDLLADFFAHFVFLFINARKVEQAEEGDNHHGGHHRYNNDIVCEICEGKFLSTGEVIHKISNDDLGFCGNVFSG
jgi:hypothetical protein